MSCSVGLQFGLASLGGRGGARGGGGAASRAAVKEYMLTRALTLVRTKYSHPFFSASACRRSALKLKDDDCPTDLSVVANSSIFSALVRR